MQGTDLQGFANPYTGSTYFVDRYYEWNEPPSGTGQLFSCCLSNYNTIISSTRISGLGLAETKSQSSKNATNGWTWYHATSTSTSVTNNVSVDGVNYVVNLPIDLSTWVSNENYNVTSLINGVSATTARKWVDEAINMKYRTMNIGCSGASYSATTDKWTLTNPFKGIFRAIIIFNRALTTAEIEWVKNNMFNYEH